MSVAPQALPPDSIRHVVRRVFAAPEYEWSRPPDPLALLKEWLARWMQWLADLRTSHPTAYTALLMASLVILVAILSHFAYLVWRALRPVDIRPVQAGAPRAPVRDAGWYLDQTGRLRAEGRYAEALAHRFAALMLSLQRRGVVTFRPWKTPAEYVREARLDPSGREELGGLVHTLYRHLFGGVPCTEREMDDFDRRAGGLAPHRATP